MCPFTAVSGGMIIFDMASMWMPAGRFADLEPGLLCDLVGDAFVWKGLPANAGPALVLLDEVCMALLEMVALFRLLLLLFCRLEKEYELRLVLVRRRELLFADVKVSPGGVGNPASRAAGGAPQSPLPVPLIAAPGTALVQKQQEQQQGNG